MGRKGSHLQDFSLYNATYRGGVSESLAAELGCNRSIKDNLVLRWADQFGCSAHIKEPTSEKCRRIRGHQFRLPDDRGTYDC